MESLKSMDACYAKLSDIATTYKKNMEEFKDAEMTLAKFLEESGMRDATPVGDVMRSLSTALKGQATAHSAKLSAPVNSLMEDFKTFNTRVVADTALTVQKMEKARLEYDAYRLWLKDVEGDKTKNPARYDAVAQHYNAAQATYKKLRQDSVTKVMMVSDHRLRLTSTTLRKYHAALASHYSHSADLFRTAVCKHKEITGSESSSAILVEG